MAEPTLADAVFDAALMRGSFTLRSGVSTDHYLDKYRVGCSPHLLARTARELAKVARGIGGIGQLVAPALGAVPLATVVSIELDVPLLIVRDDRKQHGTAHGVEGVTAPAGTSALLIEDVVTSGGAALDALAAVREHADLDIAHAACLLDRDGGGREALAAAGVTLHALLGTDDVRAALAAGRGLEVAR